MSLYGTGIRRGMAGMDARSCRGGISSLSADALRLSTLRPVPTHPTSRLQPPPSPALGRGDKASRR